MALSVLTQNIQHNGLRNLRNIYREGWQYTGAVKCKHTATVVQEVEKSFSNQKVASSIPCRSILEQDTEPLIAPDVQCAISVNVKNVYTL